jgi:hypothetical protein
MRRRRPARWPRCPSGRSISIRDLTPVGARRVAVEAESAPTNRQRWRSMRAGRTEALPAARWPWNQVEIQAGSCNSCPTAGRLGAIGALLGNARDAMAAARWKEGHGLLAGEVRDAGRDCGRCRGSFEALRNGALAWRQGRMLC